MPFTVKYTTIFSSPDTGWTESYFFSSSSDNLALLSAQVLPITQKRRFLLGAEAYIKAQRLSIELNEDGSKRRGDSKLMRFFYQGVQAHPCAQRDLALQVLFANVDSTRRKLTFMGGIWDEVSTTAGAYNPGVGNWQSYMNSWIAAMLAQGMGWIGRQPVAAGTISGYTSDADNRITFTLTAPGIFGAGPYSTQQVNIRGLNVTSILNGPLLVTPLSATTCITFKPVAAFPFVSPGIMSRYTSALLIASTIDPQAIMTRERGRPLLVSPGRRANRPKG